MFWWQRGKTCSGIVTRTKLTATVDGLYPGFTVGVDGADVYFVYVDEGMWWCRDTEEAHNALLAIRAL